MGLRNARAFWSCLNWTHTAMLRSKNTPEALTGMYMHKETKKM